MGEIEFSCVRGNNFFAISYFDGDRGDDYLLIDI